MKIKDLEFVTPNADVSHRVKVFWTKEPETVRWIDTFGPDDIFYDIGANIGLYSLWGGRRCRTFCFEPHAANFEILNENIHRNGLSNQVTAYCCSVFDKPHIGTLFCRRKDAGASLSSFEEKVDDWLRPYDFPFIQGSLSVTLDWITSILPKPTHIKIDVDGLEHKVIAGGSCVKDCSSVMIELNHTLPEHQQVFDTLHSWGFKIVVEQGENESRTILFSKPR